MEALEGCGLFCLQSVYVVVRAVARMMKSFALVLLFACSLASPGNWESL